jgi:Major tropism determinant N-terminal domain
MSTQIQIRRDNATNWTTVNPTLLQGEMALDTVSKQIKIGDGLTPWNALSVFMSTVDGGSF